MELKHSLNLLASRYSVVFKVLVYFLIMTAICVAILVSIMTPAMDPLFNSIKDAQIVDNAVGTVMQMLTQNITYADGVVELSNIYTTLVNIIGNYTHELIIFYVLISVVFFFYRLFISMTSVPISSVINDYMNTSVHKSVVSALAENLWVSIKYAFFATLLNQLINTGLGIMSYQILLSTVGSWGIFSFTFVLILLLLILSLKYALLLGWVPIIVNEKKPVLKAFAESIKRCKNWFRYGFLSSFMLYLFVIASTILLGIATCFVMVPIIAVSEIVVLRIIELVCYYNVYKKRYYIDRNTIIKPREELY